MDKSAGSFENVLIAWGIAGLAALVAFVMLMMLGGWTFMQAAFVGAIVFMVGGAFMTWAFCSPLPGPGEVSLPGAQAPAPMARETPAMPEHSRAPQPAVAAAAASVAAAEPEPAPEAVPATEAAPASQQVNGGADAGSKPQLLDAPQGAADDLKLIKGVGPKLEEKLNKMGVWHFSQIAGWSAEQVSWVDDSLNFKGRIDRDDWIGQAKILAAGGTTEFAQRTGKK